MRTDMLTIGRYKGKEGKEGDFSPELNGFKRILSMSNLAEQSSQRNIYWVAFKLSVI